MIRCEKCGKVFADQRGVTQVRVVGGARWYCSSFRACKKRQCKRCRQIASAGSTEE